ncbi:hypothetical protein [Rhizobacter sp. OV335]|uniref:hypothetical protein n=1 Tax=Rhizobacter sp. OV335 TaxID=1500264 RepID=UPI00116112C3|nr:hypothetical protein [Rhizobacter sp. OV335]
MATTQAERALREMGAACRRFNRLIGDLHARIDDDRTRAGNDFKRHASIRLPTGAAGADFPSVLAGLLDLSGVTWPGQVTRALGTLWTGLVCAARVRYLLAWEKPEDTPRPGGAGSLAAKRLRKSMSSLSGISLDDKPMTPRERPIKQKLEAWTPRKPPESHESSSSTSRGSPASSSDDNPS